MYFIRTLEQNQQKTPWLNFVVNVINIQLNHQIFAGVILRIAEPWLSDIVERLDTNYDHYIIRSLMWSRIGRSAINHVPVIAKH